MNFILVASFLLLNLSFGDCWLLKGCDKKKDKRDCLVSEWGTWSSCSAKCGSMWEGTQIKRRIIIHDANCGECGKLSEVRGCYRECCPEDCVYSWGAWSSCKGTCGLNGEQTSLRIISQNERCGGTCNVNPSRKRTCDTGK